MRVTLSALRGLLPALLSLVAFAAPAVAQDNADCMRCHKDRELYVEKGDEELPGWIDEAVYQRSAHRRLDCIACHLDLEDAELPHADELEPVDCSECHTKQTAKHAASIHGKALEAGDAMAPRCVSCHGKHDIESHRRPTSRTYAMNIPQLCGTCHHEGTPVSITHDIPQERIFENYSQSIHGKGVFEKGLAVTAVCTSCHTAHDILPHTDPRSSVSPQRVVETCLACHANIERVHRKVIEGRLWREEPNKIPNCVDCHAPHEIRQPFYPEGMAKRDCMVCHEAADLTVRRGGHEVSLHVDDTAYSNSAHADVGCAQCHVEATKSKERACETIKNPVDCSICHAEVTQQHYDGAHGQALSAGNLDAPDCVYCHATHATKRKSERDSPTHSRNVPELCSRCHRGDASSEISRDAGGPAAVGNLYAMSIHGRGLRDSGLVVSASCVSCHGAHFVLPATDERSSVSSNEIAGTCGTCHEGIEEQFGRSVHGPLNADDGKRRPTCKDCHTSHTIRRTDEAGFRTSVREQCGKCHEEQTETYFHSYHGKVAQLGGERVAMCFDCHGTHAIHEIDHPASPLSSTNIVATCQKCHPKAHARFARYLPHADHTDREGQPWLYWTWLSMTTLLVGTMSFFTVHSIVAAIRLGTTRRKWGPHKQAARSEEGTKKYRRFTPLQRGLHIGMVLSFFTLVVTGMSLKFSFRPWAQLVADVFGGFENMGFAHRCAAIALVGVFVTHLWGVNATRKKLGRSWWEMLTARDSIVPQWRDVVEFWGTAKWLVGRGRIPRFGRWTYWEKFDYFAVFWGVAIIGSSGLVLWFPEQATHVLPGWAINVATIIHSDEALLATGFIFTIHFFNTQLRPDKFPLDPVVFTGRMSLEELKRERPDEYEQRVRDGTLDDYMVEPLPPRVERGFRTFAVTMMLLGLLLATLIAIALVAGSG